MFETIREDKRLPLTILLGAMILVAILVFGDRPVVAGDGLPLWGGLEPGPYAVGFRSTWQFDFGRTYSAKFNDGTTYASAKAARPMLVNIWYPAERGARVEPMAHGGYLEIGSDDPRLARFAEKLAEYARGIVRAELFGKAAGDMTERDSLLLKRFWATPTACARDAKPLERKGPVVVYHSGADSSYEDNSVLCEFLASYGYVVLGSAFQDASGATLDVDGGEGSERDLAFLVAYAGRLPYADWGRVAVAGHSFGAQAVLKYALRESSPVDAVVCLDTRQDYVGLNDSRGWRIVPAVLAAPADRKPALLLAANSYAIFALADARGGSQRTYLTFRDLGHNDYISQGIIHRNLPNWPQAGGEGNARPAPQAGSPEAAFEALCGYVLAFLDTHLRGDRSRQEALDKTYQTDPLGGRLPHVEHVAAGVTGPAPYRGAPGEPLCPRQLRGLLKERGPEATVAVLEATRAKMPESPVFHPFFGCVLVCELLEQGRTGDARVFDRFYATVDPGFRKRLLGMAKSYVRDGTGRTALDLFERAAALDANDTEAAEKVRALRRAVGPP